MNAILFLSLASLSLGQQASPLQVREAVAERGEVKAGMPLIHEFEIQNIGATPLTIHEVKGGCGCSSARVSRKELAPSEKAIVAVEINTLSQAVGPNLWRTTVAFRHKTSEKPVSGELELWIKAKVVREVSVEPVALALVIEKEATHVLTLTDRRAKSLTIVAAKCESKHIKTQLTTTGVNAMGERIQQIHVTILESLPPGDYQETLRLETNDADYRDLSVPIRVTRKATCQVLASPEQIDLRLANGQTTASGLVRLRDPDDQPVVVERMEADHPAVTTKWVAGPGNMVTLRLGINVMGQPEAGLSSVKVHLKEPKPQVIVIPVSWRK
ncbi:MAG: DUF1573 domain-containing protein [Planctomycetes bacterium]|nr:DUF1573 domain-containing protein [Planctomycetota bacterium]